MTLASRSLDGFLGYLRNLDGASPSRELTGKYPTAPSSLKELFQASGAEASTLADRVAEFWNLSRVSLPELLAYPAEVEPFSRRFLREAAIFPFRTGRGHGVAVADPTDTAAIRAAELVFGGPVQLVIASYEDISTVLDQRFNEHADQGGPSGEHVDVQTDDDIESLRDLASGEPVIRAVNDLVERALELRASDIHIEPLRNGLRVRFRVDGMLRVVPTPPGISPHAILSRVKILAGLNIAERRLPQDGAARLTVARRDIDLRVATMPTQHGESAVIRILQRDRGLLDIGGLGLSEKDGAVLGRLLALPYGMIVVTGPTGSGKTTTLATMLSILNESSRKILTIEDPVEYEIPGINQSQVQPSIGLGFAAALRSFVRQDPDVIMVGEVRDPETAHIAIHAALTGHLVLTTLHTETASAAVPRLLDLGVEDFLLRSTLRGVIGQRLVRVLCDRCKTRRQITSEDLKRDARLEMLGLAAGDEVHEPQGCERCGGTGYRGRNGIFEVLEITEALRPHVSAQIDASAIDTAAVQAGMTTMFADAVNKCRAGMTSVSEVLRVSMVR